MRYLVAAVGLCMSACSKSTPSQQASGAAAPTTVASVTSALPSSSGTTPPPRAAVVEALPLPDGPPGIGFDDVRFSSVLAKLLVPAGRSGNIDLVDPATRAITAIGGFSKQAAYEGGHDFGVTSVDVGRSLLYATDRTTQKLVELDPTDKHVVASVKLAASPDYVRFVAHAFPELWVTEPDASSIEVLRASDKTPVILHEASIKIEGGPESLAIDMTRGRAYTHTWKDQTLAIDLRTRAVVARWSNGCAGSRGIALDEARGWLFVGCAEGKASVIDVANGSVLGTASSGDGVDIIDYSPSKRHLYLPGGKSATMAILSVSGKGELAVLGTVPTARGAHCVAADPNGHAYVCDPDHGQMLVVTDPYPSSM